VPPIESPVLGTTPGSRPLDAPFVDDVVFDSCSGAVIGSR
jgi:hypothetical protein